MNAAQCEFLSENEWILVMPNFTESPMQLICGEVGPFEAGVPVSVPIWLAIHLKKRHKCSFIAPHWLNVEELKKLIVAETEKKVFGAVPNCLFEIAHIILINGKDDIENVGQLKTLVKDLWDKRTSKLRTSSIEFLRQHESSQARLDCLTPLEVAYARPVLTEATRTIEMLNETLHSVEMINFSRFILKAAPGALKQVRNSSGGAWVEGENVKNTLAFTYKKNAEAYKLWKKISYVAVIPSIIGCAWIGYTDVMHELSSPRKEYIPYSYLNIRTSPFLWGDGNHSLFHNPEANYVPGVGYEAEKRWAKAHH